MFYPLDQKEWRRPLQLNKICPDTLIWPSSQSYLLEYLMGVMESIYTELALYGSTNKCARTDTVFLPISEVCNGTASLVLMFVISLRNKQTLGKFCDVYNKLYTWGGGNAIDIL